MDLYLYLAAARNATPKSFAVAAGAVATMDDVSPDRSIHGSEPPDAIGINAPFASNHSTR